MGIDILIFKRMQVETKMKIHIEIKKDTKTKNNIKHKYPSFGDKARASGYFNSLVTNVFLYTP